MDRNAAQAWLDRYAAAWETFDRDEIGALFSDDATYRYHPYDPEDETLRGREAIVESWLEPDGNASERDEPGTYAGSYTAWAVDGDRVVATGTSSYWTDASRATLDRVYHNVFLLEFDGEGRCRSFVELYMQDPDPA